MRFDLLIKAKHSFVEKMSQNINNFIDQFTYGLHIKEYYLISIA